MKKTDDLISRQAAIDALHMHLMYRMGTDSNKKRLDDWINGVPSVQSEGIRCKDCKHWTMGKTTKNYPNPYICELHSFMHGFERSALPEDYCSWGELRGDSDENSIQI